MTAAPAPPTAERRPRRGNRLALLALTCLLSACFSRSPPVSLYTLEATAPVAAEISDMDSRSVSLGPIMLPGYLDRTQIVTRTEPHRLSASERHRWAEALDEAVARVLLRDLSSRLPGMQVFPFGVGPRADLRVGVEFHRLDRRPDGGVSMVARWALGAVSTDGSPVEGWTEVEEDALDTSHAETAAAMSRALARLADDLAAALRPVASE